MSSSNLEPLRASVLWMVVKKFNEDGRGGREYALSDEKGAALLVARAFTWGREIVVTLPDGAPCMAIVRSRAFAFNGRAAVVDGKSRRSLGSVARDGTFRDSTGAVQGRFRDARSMKERARLSLFQGFFEAVFSGEGSSTVSGPDALVLEVEGEIRGTLSYGVIPNGKAEDERQQGSRFTPSFLRARLAHAWRWFQQPRGWKLVRSPRPDGEPRLEIAAAIFAAELSRW